MTATRYFDVLSSEAIDAPDYPVWKVDDGTAPCYLIGPAFFDPQVNGFAGVDFTDPDLTLEQLEYAVSEIRKAGCSHFFLTLVTAGADFLDDQFKRLADFVERSPMIGESIPGLHLEGPFISPNSGYRGAHPAEHICPPDWKMLTRWQAASGNRIRMITLAPEWEGSHDFIRRAVASDIFVCVGHTDASYEELVSATTAGARLATHLGNGCPMEMHRHDNIVQRALAVNELMVSLIPDGIHLPPFVLANLTQFLWPNRLVYSTDAIAAAGAPIGRYRIGKHEVDVGDDGVVMHEEGKYFIGSSLTAIEGFYNGIRWGGLRAKESWQSWTRIRGIIFPEIRAPLLMVPFDSPPVESNGLSK
ncbi:MAG: N-acetylglucosamine-6-phosphate deacetylase [Planctomycetota bacterium]|jgi:N-acetylglucosamine-6-phosphate deacetylase